MAFLFQDQNQGTRNNGAHAKSREAPQPFSFIRTLTVGLGIAPNLLTLFPRRFPGNQALAGLGCFTLTAGGDFHPALRTSVARYGQPAGNYAGSPGSGQAPLAWGISMSPCRQIRLGLPQDRGSKVNEV